MAKAKVIPRSILVIEDDRKQLARYLEMAKSAGLDSYGAVSKTDALATLRNQSFTFVLTDIHLNMLGPQNTFEGLEILKFLKDNMPEAVALAMTSDPMIETYHRVIAAGAAHLFRKPILTEEELQINLDVAEKGRRAGAIVKRQSAAQKLPTHILKRCPEGIVLSPVIRDKVRKYAINGHAPIVIYGETGTGKEEVAKFAHRCRTEAHGISPLVIVNCANLSGDTAISTLFGHRKGAFTGAEETTNGYIGEANSGILFLDEIQTLSMECQQKLLRVLNDGSYNRLGDTQILYSDFQAVVASTKDLDTEVAAGRFLLDLRTRLTGLDVKLPPLRERLDELPLLVEIGLARLSISLPTAELEELIARCRTYYWQGNIRQLFQVLQALVIEASGNETEVRADALPEYTTMFAPGGVSNRSSVARASHSTPASRAVMNLAMAPEESPLLEAAEKRLREAVVRDLPFDETIEILERPILDAALKRHPSLRSMSEALGVARSTIAQKKAKYFGSSDE